MKNENENEKLKEKFEKIVNVEFNDFVLESIATMLQNYNPTKEELEYSFEVLEKNIKKLNTYDDLMRFLAGIIKNTVKRSQNIKRLK